MIALVGSFSSLSEKMEHKNFAFTIMTTLLLLYRYDVGFLIVVNIEVILCALHFAHSALLNDCNFDSKTLAYYVAAI